MSVQTEIARIAQAKTDIKNVVNSKVANTITNQTIDAFPPLIDSSIAAYKNLIPWIEGSGSSFTIDNAEAGKLDKFEMEGNTEQDSYSGINIYNVNDTEVNVSPEIEILSNDYVSCTYDNTNNSTTHYSNFMIGKTPQLQTSTNYLVVCEIQKVSGTGYLYPFTKHPNSCIDTQYLLYSFSTLSAGQKLLIPVTTVSSFDGTSSDLRTLVRYDAGNSGSITFRLSLLTDTTITSDTFVYEPYVGGIASPNPDYPQEIKVVENKQIVNVHGKNLFNFNNYYTKSPNVNIENENLDTITATVNTASTWQTIQYNILNLSKNKDYTIKFDFINSNTSTNYEKTWITIKDGNGNNLFNNIYEINESITINTGDSTLLRFAFHITMGGQAVTNTLIIKNVQLEQNSTSTEYEPYHNQDYEIDLHGKNLFDKNNFNMLSANLNNQQLTSGGAERTLWFKCKPNTTYTFTKLFNSPYTRNSIAETIEKPALGVSIQNLSKQESVTTVTYTTSATAEYIVWWFYNTSSTNYTLQEMLDSIQIEYGSTATEYEEFYDYKLCKIGDYQDVIFKNNQLSEYYDSTLDEDGWYLKKNIGKVVLDGSEDWLYSSSTTNYYFYLSYVGKTKPYLPNSIVMSDYYKYSNNIGSINDYAITSGNNYFPLIKNKDITTVEDFKTWLSNNPVTVYYVLATPTITEITNETLINQLEAIETKTGTNIFEVSNDNDILPSLNILTEKQDSYKN